MNPKTLYITDLDGTLLLPDETTSEYTANVINRFVEKGGCFSYATARSLHTALKATEGINVQLPAIVYNGVFIKNTQTNEILASNYFTPEEVEYIRNVLTSNGIYPIVYSFVQGVEKFSHFPPYDTDGVKWQLKRRLGDIRYRQAYNEDNLYLGNVFYFACIADENKLAPVYEILMANGKFNCIYSKDVYSRSQWCEIMPLNATKANATINLKRMLNCDKIVAFGDGKNDISLFEIADECYAVANSVPELKAIATDVIESNNNDGVAKWLERNAT